MAATTTKLGEGAVDFLDAIYALAAGGSSTITFESVSDEHVVKSLSTLAVACIQELAVELSDRFPEPARALEMAYRSVAERLDTKDVTVDLNVDIKNYMRQEVIREVVRDAPKARTVREVVRGEHGRITHVVDIEQ